MRRCEYLKKEVRNSSFQSYSNTLKKKVQFSGLVNPLGGVRVLFSQNRKSPSMLLESLWFSIGELFTPPPTWNNSCSTPHFKILLHYPCLKFFKWFLYIPLASYWRFNSVKSFEMQIDSKVRRCPCRWNFNVQLLPAVVTQLKWGRVKYWSTRPVIIITINEAFNAIIRNRLTSQFCSYWAWTLSRSRILCTLMPLSWRKNFIIPVRIC